MTEVSNKVSSVAIKQDRMHAVVESLLAGQSELTAALRALPQTNAQALRQILAPQLEQLGALILAQPRSFMTVPTEAVKLDWLLAESSRQQRAAPAGANGGETALVWTQAVSAASSSSSASSASSVFAWFFGSSFVCALRCRFLPPSPPCWLSPWLPCGSCVAVLPQRRRGPTRMVSRCGGGGGQPALSARAGSLLWVPLALQRCPKAAILHPFEDRSVAEREG